MSLPAGGKSQGRRRNKRSEGSATNGGKRPKSMFLISRLPYSTLHRENEEMKTDHEKRKEFI
jgi:hypothetical protein